MVDSAKKTTFKNDIIPVFVTVGKAQNSELHSLALLRVKLRWLAIPAVDVEVLGVFVILGTGNLLMAGLAYWMSPA